MHSYKALITLGTIAITVGLGHTAEASSDVALSFDLAPPGAADTPSPEPIVSEVPSTVLPQPLPPSEHTPLPIPPGAEHPPLASDPAKPAGVYGGLDAVALGATYSVQTLLPAPPPIPEEMQLSAAIAAIGTTQAPLNPPAPASDEPPSSERSQDLVLSFFNPSGKPTTKPETDQNSDESETRYKPIAPQQHWDAIAAMFEGGTESLVARAVGSAEGTRTPEGHKNPAYFGHVDPGNGVWNLGTFSYQHGAASPEEADVKQLARLKNQTAMLKNKAAERGIELTPEELLNGIDLANQAPLAALDRGGYIDWLVEARGLGMEGAEAIIWARTRSFIDPDTQRWNAPGLGNNVYSISRDQERRADAIARAIAANGIPHPPTDPEAIAGASPAAIDRNRSQERVEVVESFSYALSLALSEPYGNGPLSGRTSEAPSAAAESPAEVSKADGETASEMARQPSETGSEDSVFDRSAILNFSAQSEAPAEPPTRFSASEDGEAASSTDPETQVAPPVSTEASVLDTFTEPDSYPKQSPSEEVEVQAVQERGLSSRKSPSEDRPATPAPAVHLPFNEPKVFEPSAMEEAAESVLPETADIASPSEKEAPAEKTDAKSPTEEILESLENFQKTLR